MKVHHWYQRHRRQILLPVPLVLLTPVANNGNIIRLLTPYSELWTWRKKIIYMLSLLTQRCPNKIIKASLIEDCFHSPLVSTTPVVHIELRISPRIFEKSTRSLELGGKWFMKKKPEDKKIIVALSLWTVEKVSYWHNVKGLLSFFFFPCAKMFGLLFLVHGNFFSSIGIKYFLFFYHYWILIYSKKFIFRSFLHLLLTLK